MQNIKDGSMVGMDQCRISSLDSTSSQLDHPHLSCDGSGGGMSSSSSSRVPLLCSQRSRGSHSSSCGGPEDCISGGCATEADPLLPALSSTSTENKKASAHINKLHFDLFDQQRQEEECHDGRKENDRENKGEEFLEKSKCRTLNCNEEEKAKGGAGHPEKGSNDTVCTSSSSTSATSSRSSHKSSKAGGKVGKGKNKRLRLRHMSTDTDDTSDISATLEPPDGGWGWVVVAASFLVNLIADGVTFSFGVFFTEFNTYFKESESTTAWIGSLLAAMPLLSGPIASWLTDRYGCRKVTIVGGLLAALGFFLSSYTTSIYVLMLTFGVITGFGLSLCYVAAVVIVAYYFERRRSFATGLSVCGGGIGTFLFAPLSQYLINGYGWQRTTLILAGAFLILCLCGLLMKDLEWTKKKNKSSNNNNSHNHNSSHHGCSGNFSCSANHHHSDKSNLTRKGNRRCNSAICIPTFVQEQERRERRQRYYSCNQDSGKEDGNPTPPSGTAPKQDLIVIDRSSPGGKHKARSVKTRVVQNKDVDGDLQSVSYGFPVPSSQERNAIETSGCGVVPSSTNGDQHLNNDLSPADLQDQQYPELKMIPEEKDTGLQTNNCNMPILTSINSSGSRNGEIDIAHLQNNQILPISGGNTLDERKGVTESSDSFSNLRNLQISNNNHHHPSTTSKCTVVDTFASSDPNSSDDPPSVNCNSNHLHNHHIQTNYNNDSNNSSINNNSYNNSLSNGVIRNNSTNSGSRFVQCHANNSSVISFTTLPVPPAPNGFPTVIIPPAQQKCVTSAKMDMINSVRYRSVIHRHSLTYRGAVLNLKRYRLRPASSCPDIISVATSADGRGSFECMNLVGDVGRWLHDVCEWENLVNTRFLLFILSNLLLYTWYDVPYMYLQTAAVRHGYSEDLSSYLISSIGLSNVVGNIFLGYMGDKKWASATIVYGICMIICGGTTVLMPYLMEWSYWGLFTVCGLFGLTIAANYALTSVILVQVVSLERFASAYGLLLLVQGIGNLVGPPIAGVISDMTGTNTWSFLVAGVGIFASSFFVLAPIFQRELETETNQTVQVGHHNNTV